MANYAHMKLGKLPVKRDSRTLLFKNYLVKASLPPIPKMFSWINPLIKWGIMKNDRIGDCTVASAGHLIQEFTDDNHVMFVPSDHDIVSAYAAITGYDPLTGENDNGAYSLDVLKYWRRKGIAGHTIYAFTYIDYWKMFELKAAAYLFGGLYVGAALPLSAQFQDIWDYNGSRNLEDRPGSWGGHAFPVMYFDQSIIKIITWGEVKTVTWKWWITYTKEVYAVISPDFIRDGNSPHGFDLLSLQTDLNLL